MEVIEGPQNALLIDDTYNANTFGVIQSLKDLSTSQATKKIFVFKNIIELGEDTHKDHQAIAEQAAKSCTHILLLASEQRDLMRSIIQEQSSSIKILNDIEELKQLLDKDAICLFEGQPAQAILTKIQASS